MRPTYDAYSKKFAALRAAAVPPCLTLLSSLCEANPLFKAEAANSSITLLLSTTFVFALEVLSIRIGKFLNGYEVKKRKQEIALAIEQLEECKSGSDSGHLRDINAKIKKLKSELLNLIAR